EIIKYCEEEYGEDEYELYCTGNIMGGGQAYETLQYIKSNPNIKLVLGGRDDFYIVENNAFLFGPVSDLYPILNQNNMWITQKSKDRCDSSNGGIETAKEIFNNNLENHATTDIQSSENDYFIDAAHSMLFLLDNLLFQIDESSDDYDANKKLFAEKSKIPNDMEQENSYRECIKEISKITTNEYYIPEALRTKIQNSIGLDVFYNLVLKYSNITKDISQFFEKQPAIRPFEKNGQKYVLTHSGYVPLSVSANHPIAPADDASIGRLIRGTVVHENILNDKTNVPEHISFFGTMPKVLTTSDILDEEYGKVYAIGLGGLGGSGVRAYDIQTKCVINVQHDKTSGELTTTKEHLDLEKGELTNEAKAEAEAEAAEEAKVELEEAKAEEAKAKAELAKAEAELEDAKAKAEAELAKAKAELQQENENLQSQIEDSTNRPIDNSIATQADYKGLLIDLIFNNVGRFGVSATVTAIGTIGGPLAGALAGGAVAIGGTIMAISNEWKSYELECAKNKISSSRIGFMKERGLSVLGNASLTGLGYIAKGAGGAIGGFVGDAIKNMPAIVSGIGGFLKGFGQAKRRGVQSKLGQVGFGLLNAFAGVLASKGGEKVGAGLGTAIAHGTGDLTYEERLQEIEAQKQEIEAQEAANAKLQGEIEAQKAANAELEAANAELEAARAELPGATSAANAADAPPGATGDEIDNSIAAQAKAKAGDWLMRNDKTTLVLSAEDIIAAQNEMHHSPEGGWSNAQFDSTRGK
ncbi:MAG: hypothetical protein LBH47_00905, partial [Christensenellaceae bacterium]|nr:hypothetical protein [Christensenellaceae bacterium]